MDLYIYKNRKLYCILLVITMLIIVFSAPKQVYAFYLPAIISLSSLVKIIIISLLAVMGVAVSTIDDLDSLVNDFLRDYNHLITNELIDPLTEFVKYSFVKGYEITVNDLNAAKEAYNLVKNSFVEYIQSLQLKQGINSYVSSNSDIDYNSKLSDVMNTRNIFIKSLIRSTLTLGTIESGKIKSYSTYTTKTLFGHSINYGLAKNTRNLNAALIILSSMPGVSDNNSTVKLHYQYQVLDQTFIIDQKYIPYSVGSRELYVTYPVIGNKIYEIIAVMENLNDVRWTSPFYTEKIINLLNDGRIKNVGEYDNNIESKYYRISGVREYVPDYVPTNAIPIAVSSNSYVANNNFNIPNFILPPLLTDLNSSYLENDTTIKSEIGINEVINNVSTSQSYLDRSIAIAHQPTVDPIPTYPPFVVPVEGGITHSPDVDIPGITSPGTYNPENIPTQTGVLEWLNSILRGLLGNIHGILSSILSYIQSILQKLADLYNMIRDALLPQDVEIDFDYLKETRILQKFPFSLPWDFAGMISKLSASQKSPRFEIDMLGYVMVVDFAQFQRIATQSRLWLTLIYAVGLIYATKRLMGDR